LFYDLFLGPLAKDSLEPAGREEVKQIQNLAPGDFKVVGDRYSFYPRDDIHHGILIEALKREAELKMKLEGKKQIGF
jgi:hypothetical protein